MSTIRRREAGGFEASQALVDFVSLLLGGMLLLVVMIPTRIGSEQSAAKYAAALALVRNYLVMASANAAVSVDDGETALMVKVPGAPPPLCVAPRQIDGMSMSALQADQMVRRMEVLVDQDTRPDQAGVLADQLIDLASARGVCHLLLRRVDYRGSGTVVSPTRVTLWDGINATHIADTIRSSMDGSSPLNSMPSALRQSIESSGSPYEPIVIVAHGIVALEQLATWIPSQLDPRWAPSLYIVGPFVDSQVANVLVDMIRRFDGRRRMDYLPQGNAP